MNNPNPLPENPSSPTLQTGVGSGEATAGTLIAGLVGYITAYAAAKLKIPTELVTGIFGLFASGAMAVWHRFKK